MISNAQRLPAFSGAAAHSNSEVIVPTREKELEVAERNKKMPLISWVVIVVAYFLWNWFQSNKMTEAVKLGNVKANLHNIIVVTFAAAIGFALFKILFAKMAMSRFRLFAMIGEYGVMLFA